MISMPDWVTVLFIVTVLCCSTPKVTQPFFDSDLISVSSYCKSNGIFLNTGKTKYMLVGRNLPNLEVSINMSTIDRVSQFKYLGYVIQNNLMFDKQIDTVRPRLNSACFTLKRFSFLPSHVLKLIFKSFVPVHIIYNDFIVLFSSKNVRGVWVEYSLSVVRVQEYVEDWKH